MRMIIEHGLDATFLLVPGHHQTLTQTSLHVGTLMGAVPGDTLMGAVPGDRISLDPGLTVESVVQGPNKATVDVTLSDGDMIVLVGHHALNATAVTTAILGIHPPTMEPQHFMMG